MKDAKIKKIGAFYGFFFTFTVIVMCILTGFSVEYYTSCDIPELVMYFLTAPALCAFLCKDLRFEDFFVEK
ncbi:MAG: hypothetical protein J6I76_00205 [Oribacterium sp.]|nr:hypothetical protein [Oribacterium sp.]